MALGANFPLLINHLKKILKRKKIRYGQIADHLNMSESSVKRLMSADDAPLSKIESICEIAGISFFDLVTLCKDDKPKEFLLTKEQVKFFSKNTNYFYFFHLLYEEKMTVAEVKKQYNLNSKSISKYLQKLESLGLLEWHPGDKVKFFSQGSISIPEVNDLGTHLMRTTINNFAELVCDPELLRSKLQGKSSSFSIREIYLKPEDAKTFYQRLFEIGQDMEEASSRSEKVYQKDELELYTNISAMMPVRLYFEEVDNL